MYTLNVAEMDLVVHDVRQYFPSIYTQALSSAQKNLAIPEYREILIKRLRTVGLKVARYKENAIIVHNSFVVWITQNPVQSERKALIDHLHEKGIVRFGCVLRLDEIPEWGGVQISAKYLKQQDNAVEVE